MKEGIFDPDRMIQMLSEETARALDEGYSALRVTGEMSWALKGWPGSERLIEYEQKLNEFYPHNRALSICQYDTRIFEPEMLLDILTTHPIAIIGNEIYDNFYYIPTEELLSGNLPEVTLNHWKKNLEMRKKMEDILTSDIQTKLNEAQKIAKIGSWDWDIKTGDVWWSDELYRIFELDPQEFKPSVEANAQYVHPDDNQPYHEEVQKCIETRKDLNYDLRIIAGDGSLKYCNSRGKVEYDETNNPVRFYGTFLDRTDRQLVLNKLKESENRFSKVFKVNPVSIVITGDDGIIVDINKRYEELTGFSKEEVIGRTAVDLNITTDSLHHKVMGEFKEKGVIEDLEAEIRIKSGEKRSVLVTIQTMEYEGKKNHLNFLYDVTDIVRANEEIKQLNLELEERVRQRTAQLESANYDLESFAYSVSHDLRAPLRAISGFAQIIARRHRDKLNEEGQHYFDNIVEASERMSVLIDDLLLYSRTGRRELKTQTVDIKEVLDDVMVDLKPLILESDATVEVPSETVVIMGDRTLISQVMVNLLGNALIYHQEGLKPQVTVQWCENDSDLVVCVEDNGIGIPSEHHSKIFNIFQRLHNSDTYPGTGIGLSIVKKACDLMGGKVWIEYSDVGKGSKFCFKVKAGN